MQTEVKNEKYGTILYKESFWTGKREVSVNGEQLVKTGRNEFSYKQGDEQVSVKVKGNSMIGVSLSFNDDKIKVGESIKWYEIVIAVFGFALLLAWGSSITLCSIVPIVGGAIGGAVNGICMCVNLILMKNARKLKFKLLIGFGMIALNCLIDYFLAILMISILV